MNSEKLYCDRIGATVEKIKKGFFDAHKLINFIKISQQESNEAPFLPLFSSIQYHLQNNCLFFVLLCSFIHFVAIMTVNDSRAKEKVKKKIQSTKWHHSSSINQTNDK